MKNSSLLAISGAVYLAIASMSATFAQDVGVTDSTIFIGRSTPRGSPFLGMVKQRTGGADAYIASVNASGGVNGRKIVLVDRDDEYKPDVAEKQVKALITEDKVFALLGAFGTPTLPVVMKLAEDSGVPLVGAVTLSDVARTPLKRFVFPVRASALRETGNTVSHEVTLGVKNFAVLSSKEAYGPEGATAFKESLATAKIMPSAVIEFAAKDDPVEVAKKLISANPQAILVAVLTKPFSAVYKEYRAMGGTGRAIGFSAIRIEDMQADLGDLASGVTLSQALPPPTKISIPLVAQYQKDINQFGNKAPLSYHGIDGYLEARVLVEGIRRAGPALTRNKLVAALEKMNNVDFGGINVRYGPQDRSGSSYVDIVMLQKNRVVF